MPLHLEHFALEVPDLKTGADFYSAFGLNLNDRGNHLAFRCDGRDLDQVVLVEGGDARRFHHLSFGASPETLAEVGRRLQARDVALEAAPFAGAPDGLWFRDPDGYLVNVHEASAPAASEEKPGLVNHPGVRNRLASRGTPTGLAARPRRLGHLILFTPEVLRQAAFYGDVLGMQVSDTIEGEYAAFMRTPGASDHHVLGLLHSTGTGFHHASFELASIDETELAARRIVDKGFRHAWGPGRHGVGSNYFHYFRDPWNSLHEYFFDIDFVPDGGAWQEADWTRKDGMFLWAADGPPPPDFGKNYELG